MVENALIMLEGEAIFSIDGVFLLSYHVVLVEIPVALLA